MLRRRAALALLAPLLACGQGAPAGPCTVGGRGCSEWVLVTRADAPAWPPAAVQQWLAAQGWPVRRRLDDIRTLLTWLPQGAAGERAAAQIRAQAWCDSLSPQPVPAGR